MAKLDPGLCGNLDEWIPTFAEHLKSTDYAEERGRFDARSRHVRHEFGPRIADLTEADLVGLFAQLLATKMWGNKQYLAQKVIDRNGLEALRTAFGTALRDPVAPAKAYESLSARGGMGPAMVTEILTYWDAGACAIWNSMVRDSFERLALDSLLPRRRLHPEPEGYVAVIEVTREVAAYVGTKLKRPFDLYDMNLFFWIVKARTSDGATEGDDFDHDEVRDLVEAIGQALGFETRTEQLIAKGAKVDVIWQARIANLGMVSYVFEVQKGGSWDSLLINLQKAYAQPSVQKVVAVSDSAQLASIRGECEGLPDGFRRSLAFWPVAKVHEASQSLQRVNEIIGELGLMDGGLIKA